MSVSKRKKWPSCFKVPNSMVHRLVYDEDEKRFPFGRAKCAPFGRKAGDATMEPNDVTSTEFCKLCL